MKFGFYLDESHTFKKNWTLAQFLEEVSKYFGLVAEIVWMEGLMLVFFSGSKNANNSSLYHSSVYKWNSL